MADQQSTRSTQAEQQGSAERRAPECLRQAAPTGLNADILALQRTAGNRAVTRLLQSNPADSSSTAGALSRNVSHPDDPLEQEADRVAAQVGLAPASSSAPEHVGQTAAQRAPSSGDPANRGAARSPGGQPLADPDRAFFESRLGHDFSDVRVHTDTQAADLADRFDAHAFTVGKDIVFGEGRYAPGSAEGKRLLAHEMAHVVQHATGATRAAGSSGGVPIMRQPKDEAGASKKPESKPSQPPSGVPEPSVVETPFGATIATVYFAQNAFLLDPVNAAAVEQVKKILGRTFAPVVQVDGHASKEGTKAYNKQLSKKRREQVIALLKDEAAGEVAFGGAHHGELKPAVEETAATPDGLEQQRARNRRVEISIMAPFAAGTLQAVPVPQPDDEFNRPPPPLPMPSGPIPPEAQALPPSVQQAAEEAGAPPGVTFGGLAQWLADRSPADRIARFASKLAPLIGQDPKDVQKQLEDAAKSGFEEALKAALSALVEGIAGPATGRPPLETGPGGVSEAPLPVLKSPPIPVDPQAKPPPEKHFGTLKIANKIGKYGTQTVFEPGAFIDIAYTTPKSYGQQRARIEIVPKSGEDVDLDLDSTSVKSGGAGTVHLSAPEKPGRYVIRMRYGDEVHDHKEFSVKTRSKK